MLGMGMPVGTIVGNLLSNTFNYIYSSISGQEDLPPPPPPPLPSLESASESVSSAVSTFVESVGNFSHSVSTSPAASNKLPHIIFEPTPPLLTYEHEEETMKDDAELNNIEDGSYSWQAWVGMFAAVVIVGQFVRSLAKLYLLREENELLRELIAEDKAGEKEVAKPGFWDDWVYGMPTHAPEFVGRMKSWGAAKPAAKQKSRWVMTTWGPWRETIPAAELEESGAPHKTRRRHRKSRKIDSKITTYSTAEEETNTTEDSVDEIEALSFKPETTPKSANRHRRRSKKNTPLKAPVDVDQSSESEKEETLEVEKQNGVKKPTWAESYNAWKETFYKNVPVYFKRAAPVEVDLRPLPNLIPVPAQELFKELVESRDWSPVDTEQLFDAIFLAPKGYEFEALGEFKERKAGFDEYFAAHRQEFYRRLNVEVHGLDEDIITEDMDMEGLFRRSEAESVDAYNTLGLSALEDFDEQRLFINSRDDLNGNTPLISAVRASDLPRVKFLLAHGAYTNAANNSGETALLIAVRHQSLAMASELLNYFAKVNHCTQDGRSILAESLLGHNPDLYSLLREKGARFDFENANKETLYFTLIRDSGFFDADVVKNLVDNARPKDVNHGNSYGQTLLHTAT